MEVEASDLWLGGGSGPCPTSPLADKPRQAVSSALKFVSWQHPPRKTVMRLKWNNVRKGWVWGLRAVRSRGLQRQGPGAAHARVLVLPGHPELGEVGSQ